jgi:hypothetical protein
LTPVFDNQVPFLTHLPEAFSNRGNFCPGREIHRNRGGLIGVVKQRGSRFKRHNNHIPVILLLLHLINPYRENHSAAESRHRVGRIDAPYASRFVNGQRVATGRGAQTEIHGNTNAEQRR